MAEERRLDTDEAQDIHQPPRVRLAQLLQKYPGKIEGIGRWVEISQNSSCYKVTFGSASFSNRISYLLNNDGQPISGEAEVTIFPDFSRIDEDGNFKRGDIRERYAIDDPRAKGITAEIIVQTVESIVRDQNFIKDSKREPSKSS